MRIVGGKYKGFRFTPTRSIKARPTTDLAKESLINILNSSIEIEGKNCLDLFCGTGNISFEFASHGAKFITAIDISYDTIHFVKDTFKTIGFTEFDALQKNVFKWLKVSHNIKYDIIFADPPYDISNIETLPNLIFESDLINENSLLIVEHRSNFNFSHPNLVNIRKYGQTAFSFFSGIRK